MPRALFFSVVLLAGTQSLFAETLLHPAENSVPVAIVRIERTARFTEVAIETQAPRQKVCWAASGSDSSFLLANGRRYRLIEGDKIASCPATRDYGAHETMVLRFEPLEPQVGEILASCPDSEVRKRSPRPLSELRNRKDTGNFKNPVPLLNPKFATVPAGRGRRRREPADRSRVRTRATLLEFPPREDAAGRRQAADAHHEAAGARFGRTLTAPDSIRRALAVCRAAEK